jgi:hypothetical protein
MGSFMGHISSSSWTLLVDPAGQVRYGRRILMLALISAIVLAFLCARTAAGYVKRLNWEARTQVATQAPIEAIAGPGELQIAGSVRQIEVDLLAGRSVSTPTEVGADSVVGLRLTLRQADAARLQRGEYVDVRLERYAGHIYHGQVIFVSPEAQPMTSPEKEGLSDSAGRVWAVRIEIENPDRALQPGAVGNAAITPRAAILDQSLPP